LICRPGSSRRIRLLKGGAEEALTFFQRLSKGGRAVKNSSFPGTLIDLPGGARVGFRPASTSDPPTIDVFVKGLGVREIKFIP